MKLEISASHARTYACIVQYTIPTLIYIKYTYTSGFHISRAHASASPRLRDGLMYLWISSSFCAPVPVPSTHASIRSAHSPTTGSGTLRICSSLHAAQSYCRTVPALGSSGRGGLAGAAGSYLWAPLDEGSKRGCCCRQQQQQQQPPQHRRALEF